MYNANFEETFPTSKYVRREKNIKLFYFRNKNGKKMKIILRNNNKSRKKLSILTFLWFNMPMKFHKFM